MTPPYIGGTVNNNLPLRWIIRGKIMTNHPSRYEDIIHLPHPVSKKRKRMSRYDRAAQFSPFAALVGYDAAIQEEGRRTSERRELAQDAGEALNREYALLLEHLEQTPRVEVTWFREDDRKEGGAYITSRGTLTALSPGGQWLELDGEERIRFSDIFALEIPVFRES